MAVLGIGTAQALGLYVYFPSHYFQWSSQECSYLVYCLDKLTNYKKNFFSKKIKDNKKLINVL